MSHALKVQEALESCAELITFLTNVAGDDDAPITIKTTTCHGESLAKLLEDATDKLERVMKQRLGAQRV